jgi:hypothetical protein
MTHFHLLVAVWLLLLAVFALTGGCATANFPPDGAARTAQNLPDYFRVGTPTGTTTVEPIQGEGCQNPMVDPRTEARLRLVRSQGDRGDYEVPGGRYGVGTQELLRLECKTGRVVGIVPR